MATDRQIKELSVALLKALDFAKTFDETEDGGTCNFDTPQIILSGWTRDCVERAFRDTGLRFDVEKSGRLIIVSVFGCSNGQGNRRTTMAEAFRDSLRSDGFDAYVYYQID